MKQKKLTVNNKVTSYTYYLEPKLSKLFYQSTADEVSIENMKKNIKNYIYNASYSYKDATGKVCYTKKKTFLENIDKIDSKKELYWYCLNSVNKARKTFI